MSRPMGGFADDVRSLRERPGPLRRGRPACAWRRDARAPSHRMRGLPRLRERASDEPEGAQGSRRRADRRRGARGRSDADRLGACVAANTPVGRMGLGRGSRTGGCGHRGHLVARNVRGRGAACAGGADVAGRSPSSQAGAATARRCRSLEPVAAACSSAAPPPTAAINSSCRATGISRCGIAGANAGSQLRGRRPARARPGGPLASRSPRRCLSRAAAGRGRRALDASRDGRPEHRHLLAP